jgi:L-iditol 2-dehydrogenase
MGADHYLSAAERDPVQTVRTLTDGEGADVVIVAANATKAAEEAIAMAGIGARVCFFAGMPTASPTAALDVNLIHYREISVYGAFSSRRRHADIALDLIAGRRLDTDALITHRLQLDELLRAIEMKGTGESIKAVVLP